MILESKFNLEDTVYYLKDDKVVKGNISSINVEVNTSGPCKYLVRYFIIDGWISENRLYKTRKELATALIGENLDD